jgi:hypothetical protein
MQASRAIRCSDSSARDEEPPVAQTAVKLQVAAKLKQGGRVRLDKAERVLAEIRTPVDS